MEEKLAVVDKFARENAGKLMASRYSLQHKNGLSEEVPAHTILGTCVGYNTDGVDDKADVADLMLAMPLTINEQVACGLYFLFCTKHYVENEKNKHLITLVAPIEKQHCMFLQISMRHVKVAEEQKVQAASTYMCKLCKMPGTKYGSFKMCSNSKCKSRR